MHSEEDGASGRPAPGREAAADLTTARPEAEDFAPQQETEQAERELFLQAVQNQAPPDHADRGEMVSGSIVSYSGEWAIVDLGGKSEGFISAEELKLKDGSLPAAGSVIEACVVSSGTEGLYLSRKLAKGIRDREFLLEAYQSRIPVEGRVVSRNKGGFEVELAGLRAFCPVSQIELRFCEEPDVHLNNKYSFLITKYEVSGRRPDIVLSRRALLEAEEKRKAEELRRTLRDGEIVNGKVRSVHPFGAFIDLGGLDGLLPASEISYDRHTDPREVLKAGEEVHVQVLGIEGGGDKITLSLKRLETDPWDEVLLGFPAGSRSRGKVVKLEPFGAFIELAPGLEGLLHVSKLNTPNRVSHPKQVLEVGREITVEVVSVDPEQRRISLARVPEDGEFGEIPLVGDVVAGKVDSVANFGVFVLLGPGRKGLIPNAEMGTPRGSDHRKSFPPGTPLRVKVLEVAEGGKRIRLSLRAVGEDQEREQVDEYLQANEAESGFGKLGDLLQKSMKNR